jgi:hypothetical protein
VARDRPRLLARRSELGYVESPAAAIRDEPEAIDPEWVTLHHRLLERQRRHAAAQDWPKTRGVIERAITRYETEHELPRELRSVDKRLGLRP